MKLTREQLSQLSDIELNRAMVWCYPPRGRHIHVDRVRHWLFLEGRIDYLTDYNLTMPLAIEHKLNTKFYSDGVAIVEDESDTQAYSENVNPLRAICEVLIMIAMERGV